MLTPDSVNEGLVRGEFFLEYLPTLSLTENRCVGAEALARWRRPERLVPPDEFIPIIEETIFAGPFTHWVIETMGKELRDWLEAHGDAHIGVNIPPILLGRGGLMLAVKNAGLEGFLGQLMIEITERGLPDRIGVGALEYAARSGVQIALDDVELSGANITILTRCRLDVIKIERSLVSQITPESPCPDWLAGLAALLRATPVKVIAEGVETAQQAEALRNSGVTIAQGFYFSPPLSAGEFMDYYSRHA